jgi:hypothetical protein
MVGVGLLPAYAQDADVVVPDLFGMSVPQAAAELNQVGLTLGEQLSAGWSEDSGAAPNSVGAHSTAFGTTVPAGTAISVLVLRDPNMRSIYDDNDLTLLNLSGSTADLTRLSFAATDGSASFSATRLSGDLRAGACVQVWSIVRSGAKSLAECEVIQRWLSTGNRAEHFWTAVNGTQEFAILDEGVPLANCPAAPVGTEANPYVCDFYFSGADSGGSSLTEYLYFAYTPEAIALINVSEDHWMPTGTTPIFNYNPGLTMPGLELYFGDPTLFGEDHRRRAGSMDLLAPGQCLVLTNGPIEADAAPQPCHVIAQRDLGAEVAFWLADFEIESVSSDTRQVCPAAIPDQPTLCVVPR